MSTPFSQCHTLFVPQTEIRQRYIFCDVSAAVVLCCSVRISYLYNMCCILSTTWSVKSARFASQPRRKRGVRCSFVTSSPRSTAFAMCLCESNYPVEVAKTRNRFGCFFDSFCIGFVCRPGLANVKNGLRTPFLQTPPFVGLDDRHLSGLLCDHFGSCTLGRWPFLL